MTQPDLYIITGISGSGKTSVARALIERGEVAFDSKVNAALFHFEDKFGNAPLSNHPNDPEWKRNHKWVIDQARLEALMAENQPAKRVFLCGGGDSLKSLWPTARRVFLLKIDADTLVQRLNSPTRDNDFAKNAITQDHLLKRLDVFQTNQLAAGAQPIDARRSLNEIVEEILNRVQDDGGLTR